MSSSSIQRPISQAQVTAALRLLQSPHATRQERQQAFDMVKQVFVPVTNQTPEYAAELERVFALRFPVWPAPPRTAVNPQLLADRIRGLVFGNALGDAVGLSTEFMNRQEIVRHYPSDHVFRPSATLYPDMHRLNFCQGDWTDDTDQLVLILQTLLEHQGQYNGPAFAAKLLDWKNGGFGALGDESGAGCGRTTLAVLHHPAFLDNPQHAAAQVWQGSGRVVAPNGAVMRTAITAVPYFWNAKAVETTTTAYCRATHADPRCRVSCLVIAETIRLMLVHVATTGAAVPPAQVPELMQQAMTYSLGVVGSDLNAQAVQELETYCRVTELNDLELDSVRTIGYTYKCMGSGMWALRTAVMRQQQSSNHAADATEIIRSVLQDLVRAGGDADTNGAVAGAMLGAYFGFAALPWTNELPYGFWLEAWVQKLLFMLRLPIVNK